MRKSSINRILIGVAFILALLVFTRLEFDNFKAKTISYPILWLGIGILGFKYFKNLRGSASAIRKSLLGLGLAFYLIGSLFFGIQFIMCAESKHGISFINKRDIHIRLECRTADCYLTTDPCQLYKVRQLTKHIKWVTEFNEVPVDTSKWQHRSFP